MMATFAFADSDEPAPKLKKSSGFIPIPAVFYTPETGFGGGFSFIYFYRGKTSPPDGRPSNISAVALYTENEQFLASVGPKIYYQEEMYLLDAGVSFRKFPEKFFGIGDDARLKNEEPFTPLIYTFEMEWSRQWIPHFYGGPFYHYYRYEIVQEEKDGLLDSGTIPGSKGGLASGGGVVLTWDNRDNTFYTRRGQYYRALAVFYGKTLGSDFSFSHYNLDARYFIPILDRHALAFQALVDFNIGEAPFTLLSELGGSNMLRGIYGGRFRDKSLAAFQTEYRFPIWWRFLGAAFIGAGDTAESLNLLNIPDFKIAGGGGLRVLLSRAEKITLRFDVGVGREGPGYYFLFSEAF